MGSLLLLISLQIVYRNFPLEDTIDFMMAIKDAFRKAKGTRVRAAGKWLITFLQMYGEDIYRDVRDFHVSWTFAGSCTTACAVCLRCYRSTTRAQSLAGVKFRFGPWQHVKGAGNAHVLNVHS